MAEDNPWKKQMLNRAPAANNNPAPSPVIDTGSQPTNPWKAKMNNATVVPATATTPTSSVPPWKKPEVSSPPTSINNNPWKKAQQNTGNNNAAEGSTFQNNPWKKNTINSGTSSSGTNGFGASGGFGLNANANKFGGNKIETIKQKKEREERQRLEKQKQEQERIQNQRIEREKREEIQRERIRAEEARKAEEQRLKQEADRAREVRMMQLEEKISVQRQKEDRQEQQKRATAKNKKMRSPGIKPNINKSLAANPTKTARRERQLGGSSIPQEWWECTGSVFVLKSVKQDNYESYSQRMERQKEIMRIQLKQFRNECEKEIVSNVMNPERSMRYIKQSGAGSIQYTYALMTSKLDPNTSRTIFEDKQIRQLKQLHKWYDRINEAITQILKKMDHFKLRVPLVAQAEYKGVFCFAQAITPFQLNTEFININKIPDAEEDVKLLEKQLRKLGVSLDANVLQCKVFQLPPNYPLDQVYMLYVKKPQPITSSSKTPVRSEHLEGLDWIYRDKSIKTSLKIIDDLVKTQGSQYSYLSNFVDCIRLAKAINKVYRSGQAELEEANFWKLIFTNDDLVWDMIKDAGYTNKKLRPLGILVKAVEYYCGVEFEAANEIIFQDGPVLKTNLLKWNSYSSSRLELVEVTNNYHKFLNQGKLELATEAIFMRYQIVEAFETLSLKVNLVLDHAQLMLFKGSYADSLAEVSKVQSEVLPFQFQRIRMYSILIKNYCSMGDEQNLLKAFETLFNELNFYYGPESPLHVTLYSILGYFYSSRKFRESIDFYQLALGVALNVYHPNHPTVGEIYTDLAQAYIFNGKIDEAEYNIENASKSFSVSASGNSRFSMANPKLKNAKLDVLRVKVLLLKSSKGTGGKEQALKILDKSMKIYLKFEKINELLDLYVLRLGLEQNPAERQLIIDAMYKLAQSHHKASLIKRTYQIALRELIPKMSKSKVSKLGEIVSKLAADEDKEPTGMLGINHDRLCDTLRRAANMLQNGPASQQKGEDLLSGVLGCFSEEDWRRVAGQK